MLLGIKYQGHNHTSKLKYFGQTSIVITYIQKEQDWVAPLITDPPSPPCQKENLSLFFCEKVTLQYLMVT